MIDPSDFEPPAPGAGEKGYSFAPDLKRAIKVALATSRPLLLRGWPGTGKSRLASALASELDAPLFSEVVTSATEARDLEWFFDAVQRLCDAQAGPSYAERVRELGNYVKPRALWWAFDPESARKASATQPGTGPGARADRAVVLVDEIDKAEPQVTNDLLEPFDGKGFTVAETGKAVAMNRDVVLIVTTNEEKDLPQAFLRRCVVHRIPLPDQATLVTIGRVHFNEADAPAALLTRVAEKTVAFQQEAEQKKLRPPATAEYLDAVSACRLLSPNDDGEWDAVMRLSLWKHE